MRGPKNLGISREFANIVAVISVLTSITLVALFSAGNLPMILTAVGPLLVILMAAFKSTEAADTAAKNQQIAEFTASQQAAMQQTVMAHCSDLCPFTTCGLRKKEKGS